ncbi:MAG TPA: 4-(cytidine 5'-diphospho)-2-C-methyl-D-erythritol kinase, partial [Thermodesulfovibrionales bacterium]|nr:4-(cytidine 5'-diphospho)-2-C-methyl-D-erythritol kinase [Thermodesulfovibrionales bacterium]
PRTGSKSVPGSLTDGPIMLQLNAPAKINWFLSVLGKRGDGYHEISSLMQCIDLCDTLLFEHCDTLEVVSDVPGLPVEQNLVFRAAKFLSEDVDERRGARITLKKEIPLTAGMGGGSSDAAFTLAGLDRLWGTGLGVDRLREIGAAIGSDVPFFIDDVYAIVQGRGERITPLEGASEVTLLLVNPLIPVSAAWAYAACQIELTKKPIDIKLFCQTLARKDFDALKSMLVNDLESAVIAAYPEIGRIKESLYRFGAAAAAMSGSGSTVFGVFRSPEEAHGAAAHMGPYWHRVVRTLGHALEQ